jgi:hypothetical protein
MNRADIGDIAGGNGFELRHGHLDGNARYRRGSIGCYVEKHELIATPRGNLVHPVCGSRSVIVAPALAI